MTITRYKRITLGLLIAPLIIPSPVIGFILWDSLGHWRTTALTFTEYYYLPLALLRVYLLIAYAISIASVLALSAFYRQNSKKEMKPQQAGPGYPPQSVGSPDP